MFEKLVARSLVELPWVMGLRASANLDTGISPSVDNWPTTSTAGNRARARRILLYVYWLHSIHPPAYAAGESAETVGDRFIPAYAGGVRRFRRSGLSGAMYNVEIFLNNGQLVTLLVDSITRDKCIAQDPATIETLLSAANEAADEEAEPTAGPSTMLNKSEEDSTSAGPDNNTEWTPDENDVFLKITIDEDLFVTLNRDTTGHTEVQLRDGSVGIISLIPRRMTPTAVVEKLSNYGVAR
ncbi:hypothetical protein LSAT2_023406 [Lamellibrachia satsuma]|nr:hypothetical protein LSAT2_023406 [Lamellibrachia satsuma]